MGFTGNEQLFTQYNAVGFQPDQAEEPAARLATFSGPPSLLLQRLVLGNQQNVR